MAKERWREREKVTRKRWRESEGEGRDGGNIERGGREREGEEEEERDEQIWREGVYVWRVR